MVNMLLSLIQPAITICIIVGITILCVRFSHKYLDKYFPLGHLYSTFLKHVFHTIIYFIGMIAAISTIPALKGLAYSLLASSGVIALVAGFAMQQTFSNVVTGMLIVLTEPFKLNDRIRIAETKTGGNEGIVEDINLRYTVLRTDEGNRVMIPNAYLQDHVVTKISSATKPPQ